MIEMYDLLKHIGDLNASDSPMYFHSLLLHLSIEKSSFFRYNFFPQGITCV